MSCIALAIAWLVLRSGDTQFAISIRQPWGWHRIFLERGCIVYAWVENTHGKASCDVVSVKHIEPGFQLVPEYRWRNGPAVQAQIEFAQLPLLSAAEDDVGSSR